MKAWLFAPLCALILIGCQAPVEWPRLKSIDSSLMITDDPPQLLAIASNYEAPQVQPSGKTPDLTVSTRHEALRALLSLQKRRFKVSLPAVVIKRTTEIDHIYVGILRSNDTSITLLATPSLLAEAKASEGNYWSLEELTFDKSGRLLSRLPHER